MSPGNIVGRERGRWAREKKHRKGLLIIQQVKHFASPFEYPEGQFDCLSILVSNILLTSFNKENTIQYKGTSWHLEKQSIC